MSKTSETTFEKTALDRSKPLGWQIAFAPDIGPDGPACERQDYVPGRFDWKASDSP